MQALVKPRRLMALALAAALLLTAASLALAKSGDAKKKAAMSAQVQMKAYKLYQAKCLSCHVSVADPERVGKTRDGWTVVVRYMNNHYVKLTDDEAQQIINLLYALRRGLEREPG